jgi:hypothetical protein
MLSTNLSVKTGKAKQRGLARQSVARVPRVEGTVEGGGNPHERLLQEGLRGKGKRICPSVFLVF